MRRQFSTPCVSVRSAVMAAVIAALVLTPAASRAQQAPVQPTVAMEMAATYNTAMQAFNRGMGAAIRGSKILRWWT